MRLAIFALAMVAAAPAMADEVTIYQAPSGSTYSYFYNNAAPESYAPPAPSAYQIQRSVEDALTIDRATAPPDRTAETLRDIERQRSMDNAMDRIGNAIRPYGD